MERVLAPEWLDQLPADDVRAKASRADLRRLNRVMGHARILARAVGRIPKPSRVVDLGAGDGSFALQVARHLAWHGCEILLVDQQPVVAHATLEEFQRLGCRARIVAADALTFLETGEFNLIIANLFLHHFAEPELRHLLQSVSRRGECFAACEPRRSYLAYVASRCVGAIGCNAVTRHDARVSVRAGFRDSELTRSWPADGRWNLRERRAGLFSHQFIATRL